jgi:hypothetical protein
MTQKIARQDVFVLGGRAEVTLPHSIIIVPMYKNTPDVVAAISLSIFLRFGILLELFRAATRNKLRPIDFDEPCTAWGLASDELVAELRAPELVGEILPDQPAYCYSYGDSPTPIPSYIIDPNEELVTSSVIVAAAWRQVVDFLADRHVEYGILSDGYDNSYGNCPDPSEAATMIAARSVADGVLATYARSRKLIEKAAAL